MNQVSDLELHLNKLSNTARMLGLFFLLPSLSVFVWAGSDILAESNLVQLLLFLPGLIGLSAVIFGEVGWRLVLKFGESETRLFYMYDPRTKRFV